MNHLELFLNASTQMIFIVYASLSVLHGLHVSTFLKGDRTARQSRRRAHLVPCSPRRLWQKETSSFTPARWASEQRHRDSRAYLQHLWMILQVLPLFQWCLDPANFYYPNLWQRLHLSWRANIVNMRLFHWMHWDFRLSPPSMEMYSHIKAHSPVPIQPSVWDPAVTLLQGGVIKSRTKSNHPIILLSALKWLFQPGILFSPNASADFYYLLLDFFFWLWDDTTKVENTGLMGRVLYIL